MTERLDHQKLLAEIDEEVRRRRESGEIPADLERELDLVFARFAPVDALEADFEQVLTRAEQATFIDVIAPVESSRPVVPIFKKVVRKLIGWYLRYVANQTSTFAHAIARAVRLLGERVDALEDASPLAAGKVERVTFDDADATQPWTDMVVDRFRGATGRVMHGEAGGGTLVRALVAAGVDAYGVTPTAAPDDVEIREDDVSVHLRALPDGVLAGIVLSGCVDYLPVGAQVKLADLAAAKLAPGGTLVVIATDPRAWERQQPDWMTDLAPGRPLRAGTWRKLLDERGLEGVTVEEAPRPAGLAPVPKGNAVLNQNIEALNELLFPAASYAVVGTRPR